MSWRWPGSRRAGVAKAPAVVCTRVPRAGGPGRFVTRVWPVGATTNEIIELAAYLVGQQAGKVVPEAGQRLVAAVFLSHGGGWPARWGW